MKRRGASGLCSYLFIILVVHDRTLLFENIGATQELSRTVREQRTRMDALSESFTHGMHGMRSKERRGREEARLMFVKRGTSGYKEGSEGHVTHDGVYADGEEARLCEYLFLPKYIWIRSRMDYVSIQSRKKEGRTERGSRRKGRGG